MPDPWTVVSSKPATQTTGGNDPWAVVSHQPADVTTHDNSPDFSNSAFQADVKKQSTPTSNPTPFGDHDRSGFDTGIVSGKSLIDSIAQGGQHMFGQGAPVLSKTQPSPASPPDESASDMGHQYVEKPTLTQLTDPHYGAKSGLVHAALDTGEVASGMTSPASLALAGAGAITGLAPAGSALSKVGRTALGLVGAKQAIQGGEQVSDAIQNPENAPIPDQLQKALYGAAQIPMGAAGVVGAVKGNGQAPAPFAKDSAIYNLRKAYNPNLTDAPSFTKELGNQLDTILSHAKTNGLVPSQYGLDDSLAKTIKDAAMNDPYRKQYIDPFVQEAVSTTHLPGHEPMETIGDLDKRLHTINATLTPKYMTGPGGSVQQVGALDAAQTAALQAEAAGIRNTLAKEISKRTGVPADQIAAARKNYGELNDLADTTQQYANQRIEQEFKGQNGPVSISPFTHKMFIADKVINSFRDPQSQAIRKVLQNYEPNPPAPVTPSGSTPPPSGPGVGRIPLWKQQADAAGVPVPQEIAAAMAKSPNAVPTPIAKAVSTSANSPSPIRANVGNTSEIPSIISRAANAGQFTPPTATHFVSGVSAEEMGFPGQINVMHPDGRYGMIPKTELADALASGYRLAQPLAQHKPTK